MPKVSNWKDNYERAAKAHKLHSALCLNGEWHSAFYIRDECDRAYYDDDDLYNNLPEGKNDTLTDSLLTSWHQKRLSISLWTTVFGFVEWTWKTVLSTLMQLNAAACWTTSAAVVTACVTFFITMIQKKVGCSRIFKTKSKSLKFLHYGLFHSKYLSKSDCYNVDVIGMGRCRGIAINKLNKLKYLMNNYFHYHYYSHTSTTTTS